MSLTQPANIDPAGTDDFTFAIFGDLHVGSPFGNVLSKAIGHSKAAGDSFVILAGDLTDNAKNRDFDTIIEAFSSQSFEFRSAIGNHDIYFDGWENYKSKIGPSVFSFDADNVHFSFLDSAEGVLGKRQLDWLKNDLSSTSQPIKVIVSHFSVHTGQFQSIWRMSSDEESSILKKIAYDHNVALVVGGHFHGYKNKTIGRTLYVTTGGANRIVDPGQTKHYVRVTISGTNLSVEKVEL